MFGFKDVSSAINSTLMIMFGKGAFKELSTTHPIAFIIFITVYYFFVIMFVKSAAHKIQKNSVKKITQQFGLESPLLVKRTPQEKLKLASKWKQKAI